jgi:hypothetical protein
MTQNTSFQPELLFVIHHNFKVESQNYFTTDNHSVSMSWCRAHSGTCDQILLPVGMLLFCFCRAPQLAASPCNNLQLSCPDGKGVISLKQSKTFSSDSHFTRCKTTLSSYATHIHCKLTEFFYQSVPVSQFD